MAIEATPLGTVAFRPPEQIRAVRTIWRLRDRHVREAGRAIQHMQKALTTMNVPLANALSDVSGVTGQAILRAILKGERDPDKLAQTAGLPDSGQRAGNRAQPGGQLAGRRAL